MEKVLLAVIESGNIYLLILVVLLLLIFWFRSEISEFFKKKISKTDIKAGLSKVDKTIVELRDPITDIDKKIKEIKDDIIKIYNEMEDIKDENVENNVETQRKYTLLNEKLSSLSESLTKILTLVENINNFNNMSTMNQHKQAWGNNPNSNVDSYKDVRNKF